MIHLHENHKSLQCFVLLVLLSNQSVAEIPTKVILGGSRPSLSKPAEEATNSISNTLNTHTRKCNISSAGSSASFAGIISEDSWAFSHKEDLGFSIFLDRRLRKTYRGCVVYEKRPNILVFNRLPSTN